MAPGSPPPARSKPPQRNLIRERLPPPITCSEPVLSPTNTAAILPIHVRCAGRPILAHVRHCARIHRCVVAANPVHTMRLSPLPGLRACAGRRRGRSQSLSTGWNRNGHGARKTAQPAFPTARPGMRRHHAAHACRDRRGRLHRLHQVPAGMPGRCHHWRSKAHAHCHGPALYGLRIVHRALSGRLHCTGTRARAIGSLARVLPRRGGSLPRRRSAPLRSPCR